MTAPSGHFGGDLGVIGLFDLGQLLSLNRTTGRLAVRDGDRHASLFFEDGRIINAVDETRKEGESAAYQIFTWKRGAFEFTPERPGVSRLIEESTEALMLEAARRIDESADAPGAEPRLAETVRAHQSSMEALRDTFSLLATEARGSAARVRFSTGSPLDALTAADDRLIYRRSHPPRLCCGGQWFSASETPIEPREYEDLRRRLFEGIDGGATGGSTRVSDPRPGVDTRVTQMPDGHRFAVTVLGGAHDESLWVRRVGLDAPDPARLVGPLDVLYELTAAPCAWVLVAAPVANAANELLHALLALVLRRSPGTALVIAEHSCYTHRDESGVVGEATPSDAAAALRALRPSVVAIEPGLTLDRDTWAACEEAGLVLHAMTVGDADEAMTRLRAAASRNSAPAPAPVGFVMRGDVVGVESIRFSATRLGRDGAGTSAVPRSTPVAGRPRQ